MTGDDRSLFGQAWTDTDRNGCDTRNDTMRRDLTHLSIRSGTNGHLLLSAEYGWCQDRDGDGLVCEWHPTGRIRA